MHHVLSRLVKFGLSLALVLSAHTAFATVTISAVSGASNYKDITPTTTTGTTTAVASPKIFGGSAGSCTGDGVSTCDSCADTSLAQYAACNTNRIYPGLDLAITLSSDKVTSGHVLITNSDGTVAFDTVSSPVVAKGQTAVLVIDWNDLCSGLSSASCGTDVSQTVRVGVDGDGNGDLSSTTNDDYINVKVVIQNTITANTGVCGATGVEGVCQFDVSPGDGKIKITTAEGTGDFPHAGNLDYQNLLVFYSDVGFTDILPSSPYVPLSISVDQASDGTTSDNFSLDSQIVSGLTNETRYYFKVALQDEAMNVGLWTADRVNTPPFEGGSIDCVDTGYAPPCHTATPGEVLGVLSKDVNCFIATAAFGSSMAPQVTTFRKFRNLYLLPYSFGRSFVHAYYKYGPIAAKFIAKDDRLRAGARVLLSPLLAFVWLTFKFGILFALAIAALVITTPIAALRWHKARAQQRVRE